MSGLPSGTVTFLFTDIEGSTRLLRRLGERYVEVLGRHDRLVRAACAGHGGREVNTQGDAFFVAFARAGDAVAAAVRVQRALMAERWPEGASVRVRMGLHTGEPVVGGTNYVGLAVHRAARICAVGHGGQILLSSATRELLEDDLRSDVFFRDLGEWRLKDFDRPEHLFQVVVGDLPDEFPPPASTIAQPREAEEVELPLELDAGTPLAGRQAELDALHNAATSAVSPENWLRIAALVLAHVRYSRGLVPPGWYMLFVADRRGTPSVAYSTLVTRRRGSGPGSARQHRRRCAAARAERVDPPDLEDRVGEADGMPRDAGHRAACRARCCRTKRTAMPPSPAAGATILVDPERTSPTAKTPGRLVSTRNGSRPNAFQSSRSPSRGPVRT
jgi:class 3 adenylate cyclase